MASLEEKHKHLKGAMDFMKDMMIPISKELEQAPAKISKVLDLVSEMARSSDVVDQIRTDVKNMKDKLKGNAYHSPRLTSQEYS
jgi:hypothetical protein